MAVNDKTKIIKIIFDDRASKSIGKLAEALDDVSKNSSKASESLDEMSEAGESGGAKLESAVFKGGLKLGAVGVIASGVFNSIKGGFDLVIGIAERFAQAIQKGVVAFGNFAREGVQTAAELETMTAGFVTLLGSTEKANKAIEMIKKDAASTPFELPGLIQANQLLTAVTKDAGRSERLLLNVGKALTAMGKGQEELDRIIVNLQQIGAVGKASMLDIKQFAFAGIPIFNMLKKETGLAGEAFEDFIEEGGVTFERLEKLFIKAGEGSGQFSKAFITQAGTFNQLVSNMKDNWNIFSSDFVKQTGIFDAAKVAVGALQGAMGELSPKFIELGNEILPKFNISAEELQSKLVEIGTEAIDWLTPKIQFVKELFSEWWNENDQNIKPKIVDIKDQIIKLSQSIFGIGSPTDSSKESLKEFITEGVNLLLEQLGGEKGLISLTSTFIKELKEGENLKKVTQSLSDLSSILSTIRGTMDWMIKNSNEMQKVNKGFLNAWTLGGAGALSDTAGWIGDQVNKNVKGNRAVGGYTAQSGVYNVGEMGAEKVYLPKGARVEPNQTQSVESSINISINAPVFGIDNLKAMIVGAVGEVQREQNRLAMLNIGY